ncbi:MAG: hypothetical protein V1827_02555 [Candidatus Micrarchaeota archaeon]
MVSQRKPIEITPRMPDGVARIARLLNSLKLSPDPINYSWQIPGKGVSIGSYRGEKLLRKLSVLVGALEGKSLIDVGCGPTENRETEVLKILRGLGINLSSYVGVDPALSPSLMRDHEEGRRFIPVSLYELDENVRRDIGEFDIVFTSMFFGFPLGSSTHQLNWNILARQGEHITDMPLYGEIKEFIEFNAQEHFGRLVNADGCVVHFVLENEPAPNIEMAEAAGLRLEGQDELEYGMGKLFLLRKGD